MKAKIEMVEEQLRIKIVCTAEPEEPGYDIHHVQVPARALTEEEANDPALAALVPKVWQTNPFHNQFIKVPIGITQAQLKEIMSEHLKRLKADAPRLNLQRLQTDIQVHLKNMGLGGFSSVRQNHKFTGLEIKE